MTWYFFQESGGLVLFTSEEEQEFDMGRVITYTTVNKTGIYYSLVANNAMYNNSGTYVCEITNQKGLVSHDYVNITVFGKISSAIQELEYFQSLWLHAMLYVQMYEIKLNF